MGYFVNIEHLHDNQDAMVSMIEKWVDGYGGLCEEINKYIMNTEVFGGETAQAAKGYVVSVHGTLTSTYQQMFDEILSHLLLYVDGYNTIEDSPDGKIRKESLEEQQELISSEQGRLETIDGQIKSIISSVSHIVSVVSPDAEPIEQNYTIMSTFLTELDGKIEAYEELHAHDMDRIDELIDNVHSVINIHTGTNVSIAPYRDIYTYEGVQLINLLSKLDEGDATVIAAADRVNSLYEEYCTDRTSRERKENGAAKVVEGSLIFLVGAVTAVFLSRTAGAVTMYEGATIVVGAFSYIAITHGLSNVAEGVQEYRFGCSRDTESVAVNYVRDYVYFGNEKVYNGVTNLGATGCSVYLTGMGGYMYAQTYGIPIWQGELIQGGIALTSAGADRFVSNQVSTMDVDPWTKNLAGPVTGLFAGSVGNAAVTRYGLPVIKQANAIGNVGSSRSITEIATQDVIAVNEGQCTVEVNGKRVTIDNGTFDPYFVDKQGRTNIKRMEQGLAPIGNDGKSVNIHHIDQTNDGAVMEITATEHQQNYSKLHINTGSEASNINRAEFNYWRKNYWIWRSKNIY